MDGSPPQEEDFSTIPISDRLVHKNWKARVHAYESLIKTFQTTTSDNDPAFRPYINNSDLLKKIVTDANAVAQEKGIECIVNLVKFAGETAAKSRETVVPALVDKCFGSSRTGTKSQTMELVLQYVEVENGGAGVVNDVIQGLSAKQPKVVANCVFALKEIIRAFGVQVTPPAPVLKVLPKIFAHNDKSVRAEGTGLAHVLYQFTGPNIEPWLADLKPVQVKELKEAFDNLEQRGKGKGSLKPDRLTRSQGREMEAAGDAVGVDESGNGPEDLIPPDPRMLAEPVDITPKLPPSLHTNLTSSKWKERKEVLDELSTLLTSTPRIREGPEIGELVKALAVRVQGDANINCVMVAATCMEALAKAMMSSFARYREIVVPPMLERLKERKTNVTDSIGAALDAIFSTTSLADIVPDLGVALASKNPQVKEGTLKFLGRCLSKALSPLPAPQIKPLAETLALLLEDSFEGARNEAAVCMGTLMKMAGERPLNAVVDGLADVRKAKVKEAFEKAAVKCKSSASAPPRPVPTTNAAKKKAPAVSKPSSTVEETGAPTTKPESKPESKSGAKPPTKPLAKKSPASTSTAPTTANKKPPPAAPAKQSKPSSAPAAGFLDGFKYKHTPEDAETLAADLIPGAVMNDLGDSNWKTRLAALDEMSNWLETVVGDVDAEVVVRALAKKTWNEKNFQVSAKVYSILTSLAERCPSFGRSCVALATPHLAEKLGDVKLKKPAGDVLLIFGEKTSLQFVLTQAYEPLSKQKAPKVLADALGWINTALTEFGIAGLTLRSLIDFLKSGLQNSNAAVRTSATKTLITLKLFAGSGIKDLLEDLNPQLLNTIASEFDKVEGTPTPQPTRSCADLISSPGSASATGASSGGAGDPLDDLFPRVEIDSLLKGTTILTDAKSDAWKTKKEALETLQAILDQGSNKRLKPSMGEIGQVLKARVTDTNKVVQVLALDIVGRVATGMGKPFDKHNRLFVHPVATVLADQKSTIRASAIQTLSAIATACEGLDSMIHGLTAALETSNPLQKGSLLHWIVEWFKDHTPPPSLDLSNWVPSVLSSLDDRNSDVRKGAQALLPTLIRCAGFDYVMQQTNSLKSASRNSVIPLIQAARPTNSTPMAPVTKTSKPPPPSSDSPPPASPTVPSASSTKPAPKLAGVRRKLPLGSSRPESRAESPIEPPQTRLPGKPMAGGLKKSGTPAPQPVDATNAFPFTTVNIDAKKARTGKDAQKWINEGGPTRRDLAELLQTQMEPHAAKELVSRLFSHDHNAINDHISGMTMICEMYTEAQGGGKELEAICLANFDLPLKYASIKAHEPQPNLISKCLDTVEAVVGFLRIANYQLSDGEAVCFIPTFIHKLGDPREQVRNRVQGIIQGLPKVYAYSRVFQLLLDHGLKSKVAKTRQGALDELGGLLKRSGMGACEPSKALPQIGAMIADKDSQVRKSALSVLSEAYVLVGEKVWALVGALPPKDKTQLEERLRRVTGLGKQESADPPLPPQVTRLAAGIPRPASPAASSRFGSIPRPASPLVSDATKVLRPTSPARTLMSMSPNTAVPRPPDSPSRTTAALIPPQPVPAPSMGVPRPKSLLPSRLGRPRTNLTPNTFNDNTVSSNHHNTYDSPEPREEAPEDVDQPTGATTLRTDDITVTISSILSNDPSRSVDALKKVQKILAIGPEAGPSSPQYRDLADHTEGLMETITLQMAHVFEHPGELVTDENFRLAKHLIQTLNNFCDHPLLAESLTVDILTRLLEELTLRLLETDDSIVKQVKDLSRFINMIILRLFATGRRMSIFRALFALLLQIIKPFPANGTSAESKEAKVAELVLKCIWKLARSIPQDLGEQQLDPVELFPAVEHFLQSVPPNEWRARATNKVPCGDMPLRTIKVIIQHVVAFYGDDVYDLLSTSFDDPSATIVYPYVYRILNSSNRTATDTTSRRNGVVEPLQRPVSPASSRPHSPQETASSAASASQRHSSPSHRTSPSSSSANGHGGFAPPVEEPDPDAQLLTIIGHISSETTGAMHKEGITELHHFLKAYPHKRPRVEKMLESTGAAFRKYINRALASRAAEDQERDAAVADTLSKLESNHHDATPTSTLYRTQPQSPQRHSQTDDAETQEKLSRLHDIFQYRSSTQSNGSSSHSRAGGRTSLS